MELKGCLLWFYTYIDSHPFLLVSNIQGFTHRVLLYPPDVLPYPPDVSVKMMKDDKLKPFSPSRCVSIRTWTLTAGFCQRASPDWCVFTASAVCPVRSCTNSSTKLRPITEPCSGLRKRTRQLRQSNSAWSRRCKCPRHSRVSNGTPSDVVRLVRPKPWLLLFSGFPSTRFLTYLGTWERLGVLLIQTVV